jgi:hypothetical protein
MNGKDKLLHTSKPNSKLFILDPNSKETYSFQCHDCNAPVESVVTADGNVKRLNLPLAYYEDTAVTNQAVLDALNSSASLVTTADKQGTVFCISCTVEPATYRCVCDCAVDTHCGFCFHAFVRTRTRTHGSGTFVSVGHKNDTPVCTACGKILLNFTHNEIQNKIPWPSAFWRTDAISDGANISHLYKAMKSSHPGLVQWTHVHDMDTDDPIFVGVLSADSAHKKRVVKLEPSSGTKASYQPKVSALSTKPPPTLPTNSSKLLISLPSAVVMQQSSSTYPAQIKAVESAVGVKLVNLKKMHNSDLVVLLTECMAVPYLRAVMGDDRFESYVTNTM